MDALMISHELKSTLGLTFASKAGKAVVMAVADPANGFRYYTIVTITMTITMTIIITIIITITIIRVGDVIKTVGSSEVKFCRCNTIIAPL
jgi:hypothetical protein